MSKFIVQLIPEHYTHVEPFVGGGAVFLAKPPSKAEAINDKGNLIVNLYKVLQARSPEFISGINKLPYSEKLRNEFKKSL